MLEFDVALELMRLGLDELDGFGVSVTLLNM